MICALKEASHKYQRNQVTMYLYFNSSCNLENHSDMVRLESWTSHACSHNGENDEKSLVMMELLHVSGSFEFPMLGDGEVELDLMIELSIPRVVVLTSDFNAYVHSKDDPNAYIFFYLIIIFESKEFDLDVNDFNSKDDFLDFFGSKRKKTTLVGG